MARVSARRCGGCIAICFTFPHLFWLPRDCRALCDDGPRCLEHLALAHGKSNLKRFLAFSITRRALEGAARIVAVSEFTRQEVRHLFKIPQSKMTLRTTLSMSVFCTATPPTRRVIDRGALPGELSVPALCGRVSAHKNVVRIIEAFFRAQGRACQGRQVRRLEAHHHWRRRFQPSRPAPHGATQRRGEGRALSGICTHRILRIFYDAAKVFVFPSALRRLWIATLEAMAHGTPVVTSNTSSLPEVVGDAAVLVQS